MGRKKLGEGKGGGTQEKIAEMEPRGVGDRNAPSASIRKI